ncbi:MAG: ATPase, T2SS/T4P/T4SS family [Candidatus Brocadiia bacterium]
MNTEIRPGGRQKLDAYLLQSGKVTQEQLTEARQRQQGTKRSLQEVLIEMKYVNEDDIFNWLRVFTNIPVLSLTNLAIPEDIAKLIDYEFTVANGVIPVRMDGADLVVAMSNPLDVNLVDDIRHMTGKNVKTVLSKHSEVLKAIEVVNQFDDSVYEVMKNIISDDEDVSFTQEEEEQDGDSGQAEMGEESPVIKVVNMIFADAIRSGASDIHIEPLEKEMHVKYRTDGMLRFIMKIPISMAPRITARIKVLAKMDIAEKRQPQDGRAFVSTQGKKMDMRVSTLPLLYGEKTVIRLLDKSSPVVGLDKINLLPPERKRLDDIVAKPYGVFLVVGPTGSGKSTTLYSILKHIKRDDNNVITVEDPVEYELEGINQVQVNVRAGMTFPAALRSILRQDPNMIMVGEIRDGETAEIAVRASMTGHLVMSTAHTNDAASAVTRLIDIGIDKYMIASSLLGIIAQRLTRRICPDCRRPYKPDEKLLALISSQVPFPEGQVFYQPVGCEKCSQRGYKGRLAIFEIMVITERMRAMIIEGANDRQLTFAAVREGMDTLFMSGLRRVYAGLTSIDELLRVVGFSPIETSVCPNPECGTLADDNDRFCKDCGTSLGSHCPQCKAPVKRLWKNCVNCGFHLKMGAPPAFVPAKEPRTEESASPSEEIPRPIMLVVDDDPSIRKVTKALFKGTFPTILEAENGEDGLRLASQYVPELMILDVIMPGISGFEVCRRLRRSLATSQIPVVLLSAISEEEGQTKGLDAGADDYVGKPFSPAKLKSRVELTLKRKQRLAEPSTQKVEQK